MLCCGMPLTMISGSSPLGILLSWISFTATVSPVAQFNAPARPINEKYALSEGDRAYGRLVQTLLSQANRPVAKRHSHLSQICVESGHIAFVRSH